MNKQKQYITDERMFLLMAWALRNAIAKDETEYCEMIGFPRTNISNVRKGIQHFTRDHIYEACKLTGASADYIFGFQNNMMRKQSRKGIELLKEAVMSVELELKRK